MQYCSYHPRVPLDRFVDFLWVLKGGETDRRERILPSGTSELVFNLHEDEIRIYNSTEMERYRRLSGAVVSGAHSGVFLCDAAQHRSIVGVHFLPAGAPPFLGVPATELAELHINLEDLWGSRAAGDLRARLCEATSTSQLFQVMEEALLEQVCNIPAPSPAIELALWRFGPTGTGRSSRDVARELCMSQRRFIKLFAGLVGLTPKVLCRVLRFQHVRTLADAAANRSFVHTRVLA